MTLPGKKANVILSVIIVLLLSASCVTETTSTTPSFKLSDTAVVSVKDSTHLIRDGSTFAWLPAAIRYYEDERLQDAPLKSMIESEIIKNLEAKNMMLIDSVNRASYTIAYAAALESSLDDSAIIRNYGLLPGMVPVDDNKTGIEKGSLIIYVINTRLDRIVWRSAAQVGVHFDTPAEVRSARVKQVVSEMFQSFPVAE